MVTIVRFYRIVACILVGCDDQDLLNLCPVPVKSSCDFRKREQLGMEDGRRGKDLAGKEQWSQSRGSQVYRHKAMSLLVPADIFMDNISQETHSSEEPPVATTQQGSIATGVGMERRTTLRASSTIVGMTGRHDWFGASALTIGALYSSFRWMVSG